MRERRALAEELTDFRAEVISGERDSEHAEGHGSKPNSRTQAVTDNADEQLPERDSRKQGKRRLKVYKDD